MREGLGIRFLLFCFFGFLGSFIRVYPQDTTDYSLSMSANTSSGIFAPYFIGSLNHGKTTQKTALTFDASLSREIDEGKKLSWGFGVEALGGYTSPTDYMKWSVEQQDWNLNSLSPPAFVLQQAYIELKYRSVYLMAGMKSHEPALMNPWLSSGDFVESGNARPIPEVRVGFFDFVDIPLTNHWLQIQCQAAYGIMTDYGYLENQYNFYNYHIGKNTLYNYKFCHFRTNPDQRFMATFGMQSGAFFGGTTDYYDDGKYVGSRKYRVDLKSFFDILIPVFNNDEDFALGSTIGAWDFYGQYLLNNGDEICAYFQWPFEDGSGLARRNKLDGVWGVEYRRGQSGVVSNVVVEYVDYRDQSGPIHYAPGDYDGSTITSQSTGRDDYYNNYYYNSYANYGMSIGTPVIISPLYNLSGYPGFLANRANGFHLGVEGDITDRLHYRLLFGHQRNFGTYDIPFHSMRSNTSSMLECRYALSNKIELKGMVAYDKGSLIGNNFGALVSVQYKSSIPNERRKKRY